MSVVESTIDAELITLVPMKDLPPGLLGSPAGLFFLGMAATGDAGGGVVAMTGELTFDKKQEYIYEWQHVSVFTDSNLSNGDNGELTILSGPRIPNPAANFTNPVYRELRVGTGSNTIGNTVWDFILGSKGNKPIVSYGDKSLAGSFNLVAMVFGVNDLAVTYFVFAWGLYYRYQTVFRGVPVGVG